MLFLVDIISKAVALLLALSCRQVAVTSVSAPVPPEQWCFRAEIDHEAGKLVMGCTDTRKLCLVALHYAQKYGPSFGVKKLGGCELWAAADET